MSQGLLYSPMANADFVPLTNSSTQLLRSVDHVQVDKSSKVENAFAAQDSESVSVEPASSATSKTKDSSVDIALFAQTTEFGLAMYAFAPQD